VSFVITLVHGTFARLPTRDADWTREGSLLRRNLQAELGDDVVFIPFRWSGMNWPAARYRAAHRLCEHFGDTAVRYPERRHYLISHSHGGNVSLYALREAERERSAVPTGVVCLSTPFIAAQPRPITLFRFVATYAVLLVTFFAVVANVMGRVLPVLVSDVDPSNTVLYALALNEIWLEFLLCAVAAWYATNALVRLARVRREKIAVDKVDVPLRIYRSIADEASALLATSSFFSWLGAVAWTLASALTITIAGAFAGLLLAPFLLVVAVLLIAERLLGTRVMISRVRRISRSRRFWTIVTTAGTMATFALWGFFLAGTRFGAAEMSYAMLIAMLMAAVISFSALSGLGYGLTAPFLEVTAEATPVGSWTVHLFAARSWGVDSPAVDGIPAPRSKPVSLAHSAAYADEGVIEGIAMWIREQEKAHPTE
jgi:hypothetical protein